MERSGFVLDVFIVYLGRYVMWSERERGDYLGGLEKGF